MTRIAVVITTSMAVACGGGSSSGPSPAAVVAPTPVVRANLTGTWDFSLVGTPAGAIVPACTLGLSEADGSVSGVLQFSGDTEAPSLKGAISSTRVLQMTGDWVALSVAVDEAGRSFSGTYVVREDDGTSASFTVRGTKRSDAPSTLKASDTRVTGRSRADDVAFTLTTANRTGTGIVLGPILAAGSRTDVTLDFDGSYTILACFGTSAACTPFGGRPVNATFVIPGLYPAGPLQATVYFNVNAAQPAGDARGVIRFNYNPQWR